MDNTKRLKMTLVTILIFLMMAGVTFLFIRRQLNTIPRFHHYASSLAGDALVSGGTPAVESVPAETVEPAASANESNLPEAISRFVVDRHTVEWGECFSLITGDYWGDMFLWPDLYLLNDMKSGDPDLIYPNEVVEIFNRLGEGDTYSRIEREAILDAYIDVYDIYKGLGDKKNNSAWSLLWCAAKYDRNFLDTYADRIDPEDRAMAQKYIDEKGIIE
ncbi:MAG: hypothetical protein JXA95_15785 [Spirochaetales bacterium]|nr:hypothetical protein [Spirochaetales bacterium]